MGLEDDRVNQLRVRIRCLRVLGMIGLISYVSGYVVCGSWG